LNSRLEALGLANRRNRPSNHPRPMRRRLRQKFNLDS
jgi:hypothetical protein